MTANDIQHGGDHYEGQEFQHWDLAWKYHYNQFEYCATKYVERCWKKNGIEDLKKAQHHLQKYVEVYQYGKDYTERLPKEMELYCSTRDMSTEQLKIMRAIHCWPPKYALGRLDYYITECEANPEVCTSS